MLPILESRLNALLAEHSQRRVNGRVSSERTQAVDKAVLLAAYRRLYVLGYKLEDALNTKEKHIEVLVRDAWERGKAAKTIQNELSRLRVFFNKIGKNGMVRGMRDYLPDVDPKLLVVRAAATKSKSWVSHGLDMQQVFARVDAEDRRLGLMVRMEVTLGLRREEVIKCKPHLQDRGTWFDVLKGQGKGGKERAIPAYARETLDYVKSQVGKNEVLGWPLTQSGQPATLKQNLDRYKNTMAKLGFTKNGLGVTGHGLRAQFAENAALENGMVPPSLGGTRSQMPGDELKLRMGRVSEALGHHREHIVAAYFCAFGRDKYVEQDARTIFHIEQATAVLARCELPPVSDERRNDCIRMRDVMTALGADLSLKEVQALWSMASQRQGLEWKEPKGAIAILLEGAALTILALEEQQPSTRKSAP